MAGAHRSRTYRRHRRVPTNGFEVPPPVFDLLKKLSVSQISELSNLSKSYISQVKHGKRPPSEKLLQALSDFYGTTRQGKREAMLCSAIDLFLQSRRDGLSPCTIYGFYRQYLLIAIPVLGLTPTPSAISAFIGSLPCSPGGKHAYFRAMRAFYNWLYSPKSGFDLKHRENPMTWVEAPKVPKVILPSLSKEQVELLIEKTHDTRGKAIIALLTESGLRLSELAYIEMCDIDWQNRIIKTVGKCNKEGYAPFGPMSEEYLRAWLAEFRPNGDNIWGLNKWAIVSMLKRLREETGMPCNPHTFRRTFACLLRKAGVDTMTIKDLGRWECLEMVQRYTRSVSFNDSLKFYKPPLG